MTLPPELEGVLRADLADFAGYSSARTLEAGRGADAAPTADPDLYLDANESASPGSTDGQGRWRRYPDPQPPGTRAALARHYGVTPEELLLGRGSDEIVDLLVRAACPPGSDAGILVAPPTFGMYAVGARLHGVPTREVPAREDGDRWSLDLEEMSRVIREDGVRVVFVCSPGNPTGSAVPDEDVRALAQECEGRALLVLDEAYAEFRDGFPLSGEPSATPGARDLGAHVVVLRTLSKAHALAGLRAGVALADPALIAVLARVQAPYPVPEPVAAAIEGALEPVAVAATERRVAEAGVARAELMSGLRGLVDGGPDRPGAGTTVRAVYATDGNFVLVRVADPGAALAALRGAGIVVRDLTGRAGLEDALRITVGREDDVRRVLDALRTTGDPTR